MSGLGLLGFFCCCASITTNPKPTRVHIHNPIITTANLFPNRRSSTNLSLNTARRLSSSSVLIRRGVSSMATSSSSAPTESTPFSVLFVCLGNICRSPAAEAVFRNLVEKRGLTSDFKIDSAGTIGYHEGNKADGRMRAAAKRRGIEVTSISRPIRPSDFVEFDLILAMDLQNKEDILSAYERWRFKEPLPPDAPKR